MEQTKRIGIWIRVSTDMQVQDDSPEHHEQRARYYIQSKNASSKVQWEVLEVYRLEAVSGKSVMHHPEAKRMLSDIRSGRITALVFSKLARLARNTRELLEFADIFRESDADLVSLAENIDTSSPAGRLFYTIIAAMSEWERAEIAERVRASVSVRARMGKPLGGAASFGYRWENKELVIDEREAPVRKLLYELFVKHQRKKTTAEALNVLGLRTRNGSEFSDTTVGRLLRDSTAKGVRVSNYTKTDDNKRNWKLKPKDEWITVECPAIVSAELWNQCNAILDAQETKRAPGRKAVHLLSGLVKCDCGKTMYVFHASGVYTCRGCKRRIKMEDLDEIFEDELREYLSGINNDEYTRQHAEIIERQQVLLDNATRECDKLQRQIRQLVQMRMDGELTSSSYLELYSPAEARLRQLQQTVPELEAEIDLRKVHMMDGDRVLTDARALYEQWQSVPFEERRAIVEVVTTGIVVGAEEIEVNFAHAQNLNAVKGQQNHMNLLTLSALKKVSQLQIISLEKRSHFMLGQIKNIA